MFKENLSKPKSGENKEPIEGDGFTVELNTDNIGNRGASNPIEFRTGETTEKKMQENLKKSLEQFQDASSFDNADDFVKKFPKKNPYSESLIINPDGRFLSERTDGKAAYMPIYCSTPDELYQMASEIMAKHPEFHFDFETDPEGRWMKYTISEDIAEG